MVWKLSVLSPAICFWIHFEVLGKSDGVGMGRAFQMSNTALPASGQIIESDMRRRRRKRRRTANKQCRASPSRSLLDLSFLREMAWKERGRGGLVWRQKSRRGKFDGGRKTKHFLAAHVSFLGLLRPEVWDLPVFPPLIKILFHKFPQVKSL